MDLNSIKENKYLGVTELYGYNISFVLYLEDIKLSKE